MALPVDVSTCTITFGPYIDPTGNVGYVGMTGTVTLSDPLFHAGTGLVITPTPVAFAINDAGFGLVVLPHTVQSSLTPATAVYTCVWQRGHAEAAPEPKTFALPSSLGATVDYDTL